MRAVLAIIGKDRKGILAQASTACWKSDVNILDVKQSIIDEYFTMTMVVDISELNISFEEFREKLNKELDDMKVMVMNEEIFEAMHRI